MALIFVIVILGILIFIGSRSSHRKGRAGENFVFRRLLELDPSRYQILNDVMLPSKGRVATTQIDHIVVSNHGIFCIETKTYQGWIFGSVDQIYWTQVIYRYKGRFYNPLRQNFSHVKAIEDLLGKPRLKKPIVSLVVFPAADKIKISGTDSVGNTSDILRKIESHVDQVFADVERDEIYSILVNCNIVDKEARKSHIKEVRRLKKY